MPNSFSNVSTYWIPEVRHHCPNVPVILCATKIDLRSNENTRADLERRNLNMITTEEGIETAERINAFAYVECSSLNNEGVKEVFDEAMRAGIVYQTMKRRK